MRAVVTAILLLAATPSYAQMTSSEAAAMASAPGRASRDGKTLALKLDSGRSLKLVDCDDQYTCAIVDIRVHRLSAWWPKQGYYVVRVGSYENENASLVRAADGLVTKVAAVPVLSPDERFAVASDPSVNNGGGTTEILDMRTSPPTIIAPDTRCWQDIKLITVGTVFAWADNGTVVFREAQTIGLERRRRLTLRIIDNKAEWDCRS